MATQVYMEALSPTMEEGQVVRWRKAQGDRVLQGEVLAEVETDKATMELVARGNGVLRTILSGEGKTVPVGTIIAVIAEENEDISRWTAGAVGAVGSPAVADRGAPPTGSEPKSNDSAASRSIRQVVAEDSTVPRSGATHQPEGRLRISPLARRLAGEAQLEIASIQGSGPGGRVIKRDIEEAVRSRPSIAPSAEGPEFDEIRVSQMRKTIARRLTESIGPVPHFFLTVDLDMERALEVRARINALIEDRGEKISLNDLLIRAVGSALVRHADVNASWHGDHIRRYRRVHVGVAVAVDDGLITPVIRDAHTKGVVEIAREVRELAGRARAKKLKPEEYSGATFSVSNLGMFGIQEFTAVINPPEGAILALGQVAETPCALGGQVVVRRRMKATLSCDHRVIDGAAGSRFLQTLKTMVEEPAVILT